MNKEKIEKILSKYPVPVYCWDSMIKKLSTLIQQEREEAVRGFVREFSNKCLHDSINESYNYYLEEIPNIVSNFVEQYLESEK